jgi:cell division protein FtsI (penicillin-binding protein 3)
MQMGGGEINQQARERWYDYMANHYHLGKQTGIEQGYESGGVVPGPNEGYGLEIRYANTSFGQGMTATPVQMGAALAGVVNGGTYYRPHLVEKTVDAAGKETKDNPAVVGKRVVSQEVSTTIREMMEYTIAKNSQVYGFKQKYAAYGIGGKTGTAEVARPEGGYYTDVFNGMFMGFVGGNTPEYVIVVRVDKPRIPGYAGSQAAAPIFVDLTGMLINNFGVTPRN